MNNNLNEVGVNMKDVFNLVITEYDYHMINAALIEYKDNVDPIEEEVYRKIIDKLELIGKLIIQFNNNRCTDTTG